jgi:hypothetical protein
MVATAQAAVHAAAAQALAPGPAAAASQLPALPRSAWYKVRDNDNLVALLDALCALPSTHGAATDVEAGRLGVALGDTLGPCSSQRRPCERQGLTQLVVQETPRSPC